MVAHIEVEAEIVAKREQPAAGQTPLVAVTAAARAEISVIDPQRTSRQTQRVAEIGTLRRSRLRLYRRRRRRGFRAGTWLQRLERINLFDRLGLFFQQDISTPFGGL
jgi:hypothetical protein